MKKSFVPWTNVVRQQRNAGPGLSVTNGMLINNMPPEKLGLQRMAEANTAMKRADKVSMIREATIEANLTTGLAKDIGW